MQTMKAVLPQEFCKKGHKIATCPNNITAFDSRILYSASLITDKDTDDGETGVARSDGREQG